MDKETKNTMLKSSMVMSEIKLTNIVDEMRKKRGRLACGILAYVKSPFKVLLAHPGGPYHTHQNFGGWSIPKGVLDGDESKWNCAKREFKEETNLNLTVTNKEDAVDLGSIVQKGGKIVRAWAVEMPDDSIKNFKSNNFKTWHFGKEVEYPEIDKVEYFNLKNAIRYIRHEQIPFLDILVKYLYKEGKEK